MKNILFFTIVTLFSLTSCEGGYGYGPDMNNPNGNVILVMAYHTAGFPMEGSGTQGFKNKGNGYAVQYPESDYTSYQYKIVGVDVMMPDGSIARKDAIVDQKLLGEIQLKRALITFTQKIYNFFLGNSVTDIQKYLNSEIMVLQLKYTGTALGSDEVDDYGKLTGSAVMFEIQDFTTPKVSEMYRIQQ